MDYVAPSSILLKSLDIYTELAERGYTSIDKQTLPG